MRDYTLTRALSLGEIGGGSSISRLFHNWLARRSIARLQTFDDYLLRDIGVAREDIAWAARLPLTTNAALGLEERSRRRSGRR